MNKVVQFFSSCKVQRALMMGAGIVLAILGSVIPPLKDAQEVLYPMATALFFWALRGPGHTNAQ